MSASSWRKWLAIGTGAGIEIDGDALRASVVRVRPSGAEQIAATTILGVRERPAAEWGAELTAFFASAGAAGRPALVVLPDSEAISRTVTLPGVSGKELASALTFEIEALNPLGEGDALSAWAPSGEHSAIVGFTRPPILDAYADRFAEAGIPVAGMTTAAAAIYYSLRVHDSSPSPVLAITSDAHGTRVYGESPTLPVLWASFDAPADSILPRAKAQLRVDATTEATALESLLPGGTVAGAAATVAACPWLTPGLNLLPVERRVSRSPWTFAPTIALASLALIAGIALAGFGQFEDRRLLADLNREIEKVQPLARKAADAERSRSSSAARIERLKTFRDRTRQDLEVLKETTRLIAPPAWAIQVDLTRSLLAVAGESNAAADLLKAFDASVLIKNSEFTSPLSRASTPGMDLFRMRAEREGLAK